MASYGTEWVKNKISVVNFFFFCSIFCQDIIGYPCVIIAVRTLLGSVYCCYMVNNV